MTVEYVAYESEDDDGTYIVYKKTNNGIIQYFEIVGYAANAEDAEAEIEELKVGTSIFQKGS